MSYKTKDVKVKKLKEGDYVLDRNGIRCLIEEIKPFDDRELLIWVRGDNDGVSRIGTTPKEATIKKIIPLRKTLKMLLLG